MHVLQVHEFYKRPRYRFAQYTFVSFIRMRLPIEYVNLPSLVQTARYRCVSMCYVNALKMGVSKIHDVNVCVWNVTQ